MTSVLINTLAATAVLVAPSMVLSENHVQTSTLGTVILSGPSDGLPSIEEITSTLSQGDISICDDETALSLNCVSVSPVITPLLGELPLQCQLAPCAPGCPDFVAGDCLENDPVLFGRISEFEEPRAMTTFPAQGGGTVYVMTYGDGSHAAYLAGESGVLEVFETGGGGGGHTAIVNDIMSQWLADP